MATSPKKRRVETADAEAAAPQAANEQADAPTPVGVRAIKKYPNRRLYDTKTSSYITLTDVKNMVMACEQFVVVDAKTGEDLTRSILLQIIRFYGHTMQGLMGTYLDQNIQNFIDLQGRLAENSVMNLQNPLMQNFMGGYLEQTQNMFSQMQQQMSKQAETLMGNLSAGLTPGLAPGLTPKK